MKTAFFASVSLIAATLLAVTAFITSARAEAAMSTPDEHNVAIAKPACVVNRSGAGFPTAAARPVG